MNEEIWRAEQEGRLRFGPQVTPDGRFVVPLIIGKSIASINVREKVCPLYIVCDKSSSMGQSGFIAAMNQALPEVHAALAGDSMGFDHVRLSIIAFSDNAEVLLPLCKVTDVADMPRVTESGLTNYGTAFELLQSTIENDVNSMKGEGFRVYRPLVFFMSNGEPSDNWELAYEGLTNHTFRPQIKSFGFECADATILAKIATMGTYVGQDDADAGRALADVMISNLQQINAFALDQNMAISVLTLWNLSVKVPPGFTGGAGKYRFALEQKKLEQTMPDDWQ